MKFNSLPLIILAFISALNAEPLRVHPENPRYFTSDGTNVVYLTGSHTWSNTVHGSFDNFSKMLEKYNHNFIRYWMMEHTKGTAYSDNENIIKIMPWERTGPKKANDGLLKFNLNKLDQDYFDRLRERVSLANSRGQYVSIMLFQGWSIDASFGKHFNVFKYHPFNKNNNINYINGDYYNNNGEGEEFHSILDGEILQYQKKYISKVIDTVNDFDNVLYEICNEDPGMDKFWARQHIKWQNTLLEFIYTYQSNKPNQHPIGLTTHRSLGNKFLFKSKADWISPAQIKSKSYNYKFDPPIGHGKKVIIVDSDHLWGVGGDRTWIWKSFTRGLNPIFMDPIETTKKSLDLDDVRKNLGYALKYSKKINLANMVPSSKKEVCSSKYCLVNPGIEYLVYQPDKSDIKLQTKPGIYSYEWFNPATGLIVETGSITLNHEQRFMPPFSDDSILYLKAQ